MSDSLKILYLGSKKEGFRVLEREVFEGYRLKHETLETHLVLKEIDSSNPDIIFVSMGETLNKGLKLIRELRERKYDIPTVSVSSSSVGAVFSLQHGANDFLLAPLVDVGAKRVMECVLRSKGDFTINPQGFMSLSNLPEAGIALQSLFAWLGMEREEFASAMGYEPVEVESWERGEQIYQSARPILLVFFRIQEMMLRWLGWRASKNWLKDTNLLGKGMTPIDFVFKGDIFPFIQCLFSGNLLIPFKEIAVKLGYPFEFSKIRNEAFMTHGRPGTIFAPLNPWTKGGELEMPDYNPEEDLNYLAFKKELPVIQKKYPGCFIAYFNGERVGLAKNAEELERLRSRHRNKSLLIQEIPHEGEEEPVALEIRRPLHVLE